MASDDIEPDDEAASSDTSLGSMLAGLVALAVLSYVAYLLVGAVDPGRVTAKANPGFLDLVVANRTVLTAIRLAVLIAAVYVAYSSFELMRKQRPLDHFGPARAKAEEIVRAGDDALSEVRELQGQLAEALDDNGVLLEIVQELQQELEARDDPHSA